MADLPSWARKGAKVVCIDDAPLPGTNWLDGEAPKCREIYTIDRVFNGPQGIPSLEFLELKRSPRSKRICGDVGYYANRFRPLVENASDSEIEATLYRKRKAQKNQHIPHLGTVS